MKIIRITAHDDGKINQDDKPAEFMEHHGSELFKSTLTIALSASLITIKVAEKFGNKTELDYIELRDVIHDEVNMKEEKTSGNVPHNVKNNKKKTRICHFL